jgi:hemerythrin-like domain-containing protein/nucleotide-binding universal stress UspA family protein
MYRHLLVPLDSSDLSIEVVGNAVGLARAVGARITFFRALPSGDSRTRELLAKAEAAARAFGVPCDSMQAAGDRPGSAIVEAAQAMDCDLVFMASHEARSPLDATLGVLMDAGLPVLVSSTRAPKAPAHAIGILRDEHRSMAAVLHAWLDMLSRARAEGGVADAALMQAMLRYLQEFPVAVHHPKEEAHLFSRLRERDPTLGFELDELERQHRRDRELLAGLAERLEALSQAGSGDASALGELDQAVQAYAAFLWNHLGREEAVILPAAQRCLTADDWQHIDAAFAQERDPGFGADIDRACGHLFERIVNAGPGLH